MAFFLEIIQINVSINTALESFTAWQEWHELYRGYRLSAGFCIAAVKSMGNGSGKTLSQTDELVEAFDASSGVNIYSEEQALWVVISEILFKMYMYFLYDFPGLCLLWTL